MRVDVSRRKFLIASTAMGSGLVLAIVLRSCKQDRTRAMHVLEQKDFRPNAWVQIGTDGTITVTVAKSEMGQGVWTALPMLVAEELEADWTRIRVEQALVDAAYGNQNTGGSSSVRESWETLRQAGAVVREMLIAAAAETWAVPKNECHARASMVIHAPSKRRLSYAQLSAVAARQSVPESVALKEAGQFRLIGKPALRTDTPLKVNGSALYGFDVRLPGLLTALVAHCPVFGGRPGKVDDIKTRAVPGVRGVVRIDSGVAVVADGYWAAKKGMDALEIVWDMPEGARLNSAAIHTRLAAAASQSGVTVQDDGNVELALVAAVRKVEAVYETPFQAHATMEPMNCTAFIHDGICEVWAPTQSPEAAQAVALQHAFPGLVRLWSKLRGRIQRDWKIPVVVHTTHLGGGFGRRLEQDYVAEAVQLARSVDAPVKLLWTREEDMQHDVYRPASYHRLTAGLDKPGMPVAWHHKISGPSLKESLRPGSVKGGHDPTNTQGATNIPYAVPNVRVQYVMAQVGVPCGYWRSVGHSNNAFVVECFLDELAASNGKDPLAFRLALLADAPRHRAVLELAASKAAWGRRMPKGQYQGLAVHKSFGSYVAQVAEVSIGNLGQVRVHRVVCAIDCGTVVNPGIVAAQMEGSVAFALTAALKGAITLEDGRVAQSNFHDYPILRLSEMPVVETHIVKSNEPPAGVGEPGVPPTAPAVVNAIFAATGRRIRRLPVRPEDFSQH